MFPIAIKDYAHKLSDACRRKNIKLCVAESCTGGLLAAMLTDISGASDVFERGFITYSNEAKHENLGVATRTLKTYGAVSAEVARMMSEGALTHSSADLSISITGIAGPSGGSDEKPIGLVYIGISMRDGDGFFSQVDESNFEGSRQDIRLMAVTKALLLAQKALKTPKAFQEASKNQ